MAGYSGAPDAVDFSFDRVSGANLASHGIKLAARYLSHTSGKNLTAAEAQDLRAHGVAILLNWESSSGRAVGGAANGTADGRDAAALAESIGAPHGCVIYYSVDQDVTSGQFPAVLAYLQAAQAATAGRYGVGFYGEYSLVEYLDSKGFTHEWQTYAWSGGQLSLHTDLYQYLNAQTMNGAAVDYDHIIHASELGAWGLDSTPVTQDWFDMATLDDLKNAVRGVLNEGTGPGQTSWAGTNQAILGALQSLYNSNNVNNANIVGIKSALTDTQSGVLVRIAAVQGALDAISKAIAAGGTDITPEQIQTAAQAGATAALAAFEQTVQDAATAGATTGATAGAKAAISGATATTTFTAAQ